MTSRPMLFPALLLAHLAVMLLLLRTPAPTRVTAPAQALMVVSLPAPALVVDPPPPPVTTDIVAAVAAPDFAVEPAASITAAGACALTDEIQTALTDSPVVPGAVDHIPLAARSVSNSLLLWDGAWTKAGPVGGAAALGPIRTVVEARIRAASAACQQEAIAGPRLMLVPRATGVVVLAFGSGVWHWQQLLR